MAPSPGTIDPGFAALPENLREYERARTAVLPVPYDATVSYRNGSRFGPQAIISASHQLELFDEEMHFEPADFGIATLSEVEPDVRGPQHNLEAVANACRRPLEDGKFLVSLGGEHSITLGCLKSVLEVIPDICLLVVDAHADLRNEYQQSSVSHACVTRRALEMCPVTQVGIRSFSRSEHEFMGERGLHTFTMEMIRSRTNWASEAIGCLGKHVYVSVDLDGLDPALCPGVGTPEPGGLAWRELCLLLRELSATRHIVAADIVECMPLAGHHVTEFVAARLAYKLMAYRFARV